MCLENMLSGVHISSSQPLQDNGLLYLCGSGEYISILSLCDGLPNCQDGSDEKHCQTPTAGTYITVINIKVLKFFHDSLSLQLIIL